MPRPTLLAISHGTSDVAGARAIADLVERAAQALPDVDVRPAFVDVQQPDAPSALSAVEGPAVIVPLLLSRGFHVHHDLHGLAKTRPDAVVAPPLGPDALLSEVLADRVAALGHRDAPILLAVAGSRDATSVEDAEGMASLLRDRTGREVALAYLAARQPDLPTALAAHPDAVVATYLLAQGFFFDLAVRQASGRAISAPLLDSGPVPDALVDLVGARYRDAASTLA